MNRLLRGQCSGSICGVSRCSDSTDPFRRHLLVSEWYFREVNEPLRRMEGILNRKGGESILKKKKKREKAVRKACLFCSYSVFRWTLCSSICEQPASINALGEGGISRQNTLWYSRLKWAHGVYIAKDSFVSLPLVRWRGIIRHCPRTCSGHGGVMRGYTVNAYLEPDFQFFYTQM